MDKPLTHATVSACVLWLCFGHFGESRVVVPQHRRYCRRPALRGLPPTISKFRVAAFVPTEIQACSVYNRAGPFLSHDTWPL